MKLLLLMMQVQRIRDVFNVDNAGFKLFENKHNLGFTGTCNRGAEQANGKFLCFLNSDAVVTDYWADRCVSVMEENNDIGIVGSRLIYEDGILQESGGGIFQGGMQKILVSLLLQAKVYLDI